MNDNNNLSMGGLVWDGGACVYVYMCVCVHIHSQRMTTKEEFAAEYAVERKGNWVRLKSVKGQDGAEACIFLQDDKTCSIYEARPVQCRTYPFWPRIMKSREAWRQE